MNIGIVTQPLSNNYGGVLQNYALQITLKRLGHNPITFNVVPQERSVKIWIRHTIKYLLVLGLPCKREDYYPLFYPRDKSVALFVDKHIVHTKIHRNYKGYNIKKMGLDAIVLGSDQVWRKRYNYKVWKDKFLQFVSDTNILRLAYAASWGSDQCEFSENDLLIGRTLMKKFKAVSVRENSGIELCNKYLGVDAIEVLDPTLLLSSTDYAELTKDIKKQQEPYMAAYILDRSPKKKQMIDYFAKQNGIKVVDFDIAKNKVSVEEWLSLFANAQFVLTDSFHGTVFSIINKRPFVTVVNSHRGSARFYSLLNKLGLENRIIENDYEEKRLGEIDWMNVERNITHWRNLSIDFLKRNL